MALIYIPTNNGRLENPDNVAIVPQSGDVFLCEGGPAVLGTQIPNTSAA